MLKLYLTLVIAAAMGLYLPNIFIRAQGRPPAAAS